MRKAVHPMKMERFIGILSNLLQCEKVAAPELAEPSEVSRRTIQRDIESLCRAGMDANAKNQSCELGFQPEPIPPRGLSERCAAVQAGKVENRHPAAHQAGRIRRNYDGNQKTARRDDLFAVSRVYEESWRRAYRGLLPQEYLDSLPAGNWVPYLKQAGRESLILLDGDSVIGAAGCCASRVPELAGWGEIASIYLLPEYWGKGWGKLLFSAAVEQLEAMGCRKLFLWVLEGNQRARAFYERMGFRPSGIDRDDELGGRPVREIQYRLERTDYL